MIDPCDSCKEITINHCEDFCIAPDGGITASETYVVSLVDKFQHRYTQTITANGYGALCVDITGFPDGFFNEFAGAFTIEVFLASDTDETPIQMVFGSLEYECILLNVENKTSANVS